MESTDVEVLVKLTGILGALATALGVLYQISQSRKQRKREFRWQQAQVGKQLADEMWKDPYCIAAMEMLDSRHAVYEITKDQFMKISIGEVYDALERKSIDDEEGSAEFKAKQRFIIKSFDYFIGFIGQVAHYRDVGLVELKDIRHNIAFFVTEMGKKKNVFRNFMTKYEYSKALELCEELPDWGALSE